MQLLQALRLDVVRLPRLAFVGSGGKTTAIFRLARELLAQARAGGSHPNRSTSVLVTATTHLAVEQLNLADHHFAIEPHHGLAHLRDNLPSGVILVTGTETEAGRVSGLGPAALEQIFSLADRLQIPLLVEADGSRRLPLKAPAEHEPPIPAWVNRVVVCAGLSGLGKPVMDQWVHRPQRYAGLSGLSIGEEITPGAAARVLSHPDGGLKNIPEGAVRVVLLNQADSAERQSQAYAMAQPLLSHYRSVLVARLQPEQDQLVQDPVLSVHEKVAGVLLAAGASRRLGQPKQLLDWRGEPLVRHVARAALQAGLFPVVVVTGASAGAVEAALPGLAVRLVANPEWEAGQSTSLIAGLKALPEDTGAVIFLLSDQPQISSTLLSSLVEIHTQTLSSIVAPQVGGRRANPVLFDRCTFPELLELSGDAGGRSLFSRYQVAWLPWHDERILMDVDTLEDYQNLLELDE